MDMEMEFEVSSTNLLIARNLKMTWLLLKIL